MARCIRSVKRYKLCRADFSGSLSDVVTESLNPRDQSFGFQQTQCLGRSLPRCPVLLAQGRDRRYWQAGLQGAASDLLAQLVSDAHVCPWVCHMLISTRPFATIIAQYRELSTMVDYARLVAKNQDHFICKTCEQSYPTARALIAHIHEAREREPASGG